MPQNPQPVFGLPAQKVPTALRLVQLRQGRGGDIEDSGFLPLEKFNETPVQAGPAKQHDDKQSQNDGDYLGGEDLGKQRSHDPILHRGSKRVQVGG